MVPRDLQRELDDTNEDLRLTREQLAKTREQLAETRREWARTQAELADTRTELADTRTELDALKISTNEKFKQLRETLGYYQEKLRDLKELCVWKEKCTCGANKQPKPKS